MHERYSVKTFWFSKTNRMLFASFEIKIFCGNWFTGGNGWYIGRKQHQDYKDKALSWVINVERSISTFKPNFWEVHMFDAFQNSWILSGFFMFQDHVWPRSLNFDHQDCGRNLCIKSRTWNKTFKYFWDFWDFWFCWNISKCMKIDTFVNFEAFHCQNSNCEEKNNYNAIGISW